MFFSPTILAVFMGGISLLEGKSISDIKQKYQKVINTCAITNNTDH
jgi:hypothetical protein